VNHLINVIVIVLIGWPALMLGYIVQAFVDGFATGRAVYDRRTDEAIKFFARGRK
jgi:hypothetical protein